MVLSAAMLLTMEAAIFQMENNPSGYFLALVYSLCWVPVLGQGYSNRLTPHRASFNIKRLCGLILHYLGNLEADREIKLGDLIGTVLRLQTKQEMLYN